MAFGNYAGPGPSYFRAYIEWRVTDYGEDSAYVQYKYSINVDSGNFYGTSVSRSWGGNVSLNGPGWYGDSGWMNHGWVSYGSGVSKSCSAQYTSYNGAFHKSSCSDTFRPSAPTWTPKPATNVANTRNSSTQNTVTWARNTTSARPYAGQYVDRQVDGGEWVLLADAAGGATSYVDKTTRPNHAYRYRICPHNAAGNATHAYSGTTANPPTAPAAPASATNTRNSDNRNTVAWKNNATGEAPYSSVKIERSANGGGWAEVASVGGSVTSYVDASTAANNYYAYRVRAYNSTGYSPYATTGTTYNTPEAPGKPAGSRTGDTSVNLAIPNAARTATSTEVQRSTDNAAWVTIATTSGKATAYADNPGGGTFYYRARNIRGSLVSAWSPSSSAVVTICAPAAPTITAPISGAVVPSSQPNVTFGWKHNPIDGSAQTAAQVQYSTDGGATWATVAATTAGSATVPNSFAVNSTVTFRARTKGVHADWSPWSGNRVFSIRQAPSVAFNSPADGFVIEDVPVAVSIQYIDVSGSLASATLTVQDRASGQTVYARELGKTLSFGISRDEFVPVDGVRYRMFATARSTTGLQTTATRDVTVAFALPTRTSLRIETDADTGYASLECIVNNNDVGTNVDSVSVYRVVGDATVLLASDMVDGSTLVDKYAPLNCAVTYRTVAFAKSGASRSTDHTGSIRTPYAFFYWGADNIARAMFDPEESIRLSRPSKTRQYYVGRSFPVSYDGGSVADERSFAGALKEQVEADMFERLVYDGGRCVYKAIGGSVFHADVEVSLTPSHTLPNRYGTVAVDITRIDGGEL